MRFPGAMMNKSCLPLLVKRGLDALSKNKGGIALTGKERAENEISSEHLTSFSARYFANIYNKLIYFATGIDKYYFYMLISCKKMMKRSMILLKIANCV